MSESRESKLPDFSGQTKMLISSPPGKTAILTANPPKVLHFKDAHAALDWAELNKVPFFYMPADPGDRN